MLGVYMGVESSGFKLFDINIDRFKYGGFDTGEVDFVNKMTFKADKGFGGNLEVAMRRLCYLCLHGELFNEQAEASRLELEATLYSVKDKLWKDYGAALGCGNEEKYAFLSAGKEALNGKKIETHISELEGILIQSKIAREAITSINSQSSELEKLDGVDKKLNEILGFFKEYQFNLRVKERYETMPKGFTRDEMRKALYDYIADRDPEGKFQLWKSVEGLADTPSDKKRFLTEEEKIMKEWTRPLTREELLEKRRKFLERNQ